MLVETSMRQEAAVQAPTQVETAQKPPAGGFRNRITGEPTKYYSEAAPPPSRHSHQISTSARWVVGTPLVGLINESSLASIPHPTREEIQKAELLRAEPGDSVRVILEKVRKQTEVLGVGIHTATDHVLGPNSQAGEHLETLSGHQSSIDRASQRAIQDEVTRKGDPSFPKGAVAKKLTVAEIERIEHAREQVARFREEEARRQSPLQLQGIDQAGMNDIIADVIEQAQSTATIKRRTGAKNDGQQLSWLDTSDNGFATEVKTHNGIVPISVNSGETAEIVTGEVMGEPADADEAFQKLMTLVNPDGGIMLAKVPLPTAKVLLEKYNDSETGDKLQLAGILNDESMVVIYSRPVVEATNQAF